MGKYFIQRRFQCWEKWETLARPYETVEDALSGVARRYLKLGPLCRIVETYTVTMTRYKAVPIDSGK